MSKELPNAVSKMLEELRSNHKYAVSIAVIRGGYYAHETVKRFDEVRKRYVTVTHYLGKILDDGTFVAARHRSEETNTDSIETLIQRRKEKTKKLKGELELSNLGLKILLSLSMDARKPIAELARDLGISTSNASYRIKKLEKKYGIRYVIESPTTMFGFTRFVVTVRFKGKKPDFNKVKEVLETNPCVHLALITKGEYDLFLIILAQDNVDLEYRIYNLRKETVFAPYKAVWNVSPLLIKYGYIPLRGRFFEALAKKVWHKSSDTPEKLPGYLAEREYIVLKELSMNGKADLSEIDHRYKLSPGASQYTYHKLIERGLIIRATITMDKPPVRYLAILHLDQIDMRQFIQTREKLFLDRISALKAPLNKYVLAGDYSAPYGIFAIAPIVDSSLDDIERDLESKVWGIEIRSLIVTSILVGELGFRLFDNRDSKQYHILKNEYSHTEEKLYQVVKVHE